ncbi:MAG: hypothetical protein E7214_15470 [Clostridium sp.]|nr:hypothetical protein [Clostridium sp.]
MSKKICIILNFILISCLLIGCYNDSTIQDGNNIIVSSFTKDKKGKISSIDSTTKEEIVNIKDKNVAITGDISYDSKKVAYIDALTDNDPWQLFLSDIKGKNPKQLTDDENGKANARFTKDGSIYYISTNSEGLIKLYKNDPDNNKTSIIDENNTDKEVECFNVVENTVILSSISFSEKTKLWDKSEDGNPLISHTISILNSDDSSSDIMNITASNIYSIDLTEDNTKALILGDNINSDTGFGIYELNLKEKTINKLLLDNDIAKQSNSTLKNFTNPYLVRYSKNNDVIYFTGTLKDSEEFSLDEIECEPCSIFSYDISNNEIKEFYTPEISSLVFDLNIH